MRKLNGFLVAGVVALCLGAWTMEAGAGPNCGAEKASAEKAACSSSAAKAELTSGSACSVKGSMAGMFKQAPGTKASFQKIDNGVVMTISAASAEYVPVVQKAVMSEIETMSTFATSQCKVSSAKAGESSSFKTIGVETAGATCSSSKASVEKASAQKAGSSCCASKTASKASIEQASAGNCPDWMKVLCSANCVVENTAEGIRITWTTDKSDALSPLQAAGEQFHAEVSRL